MRIDLNIKNIRNIKSAELDFPFDSDSDVASHDSKEIARL